MVVVVYRGCDCLSWLWLSLEAGVIPRRRGSLEIISCNSLVEFARGFSAALALDPKPDSNSYREFNERHHNQSISGLVAEYIVAIDVTRVRFPADAFYHWHPCF